MAAATRPDSFELGDYLGVLRRRWWIIALLLVIGAAAGAAYTKVAPKTYEAAVLIQVNPLPNNANAVAGRTGGNVNMDNEAQIVQSVKVATLAAQQFPAGLRPVDLVRKISVSVPANTTFLQVKCSESQPTLAAQCAEAFGQAYLTNRRATAVSGISAELANQTRRISVLSTRVARLKAELAHLPATSADHTKTQLTLTGTQELLNQTTADSNKLVPFLDNLNVPNNTSVGLIATPATAPESPASPRALLLVPSGLLAGLLIGLLAAFFIDFRDRRIHSARDVERFLDLPVLVDLSAGKTRMETVLAKPRSRAGQAFTELGQYMAASLGEGSHVVFVAGTSTGPGCSVLAANLAATLARTRAEVVLVCADPHGTVTPELLGVSDGRGLAEVLGGSATAVEVARRPPDERRLRVITPGFDTSGVLLHLQYETSRRLLSELTRDARYVIVEVQSLGEDSDAFALAEFADAAIMSIETSLTTRPGAADCLQRLDRLRTSVLGAVVLPAADKRSAARLTAAPAASARSAGPQAASAPKPPKPAQLAPEERRRPRSESRPPGEGRSHNEGRPADEDRRRPADAPGGGRRASSGRPIPATRSASGAAPPDAPPVMPLPAPPAASPAPSAGGPTAAPKPPRSLTETRPLPRVPEASPARPLEDPLDFPNPADKIAEG